MRKQWAWLVLPFLLGGVAGDARGEEPSVVEEILQILKSEGRVTEEQYRALKSKAEKEKKARQAAAESSDDGVEVSVDWQGLQVNSTDGRFGLRVGGRVHVQVSGHEGDLPSDIDATDGTEIRRARFELKARFFDDWVWEGALDFADNETAVKDFTLGYNGFARTRLAVGHQKQPYSLSVEMSTNDMPFIERSIDNDLVVPFVDRAIGVRADTWGDRWFVATGVYGDSVEPNREDDEGWGVAGRVVVAPVLGEDRVVHIGARAAYRQPATNLDSIRIRDETTHMSNLRIVDTGVITDVKGTTLVGAEAAFALGPFSLFGEYNQAFVDRDTGGDLDFDSWHVAATWSVTGESRAAAYRLSSGEFKKLTPANNFNLHGGGWGALEFAARLASLDVNDGPIQGGEEMVMTTALNWYVNPVVRFMFEWSRILDTDDATELRNAAEDLNILQFRGELAF